MKTLAGTALIAFALAFVPVYASTADETPQSTEARDKPEESQTKREVKTSDTSSCRRDARGLTGPERARFMTECIKKRD